jgi:transcriptional regulator with XRE-family HTH domain
MAMRNIIQSELVEKTGINKGALSSYLAGRYMPKQNNTYLLAKALDVNEAWLMGADVPMERTREEPPPSMDLDNLDIQIMELYKKLPIEKKKALIQFLKSLGE